MVQFYKTLPFLDYYKNEDENAKDLAMTKEMYPADTLQYQSAVENRLDELEQSGGCFITAVVGMIFNCELCRRRCRYRRYRRFW